jgi:putative multiple sugar transport system substrate-binding protein
VRKTVTGLLALGMALTLAACGSESAEEAASKSDQLGATVGIAMPTKVSTRWIADGNAMAQQFQALGYKTDLRYADNDVKTQVSQVKDMIAKGDKALVIASVDGGALTGVLQEAKAKNIPVIAYDRLIVGTPNVDFYSTFDNAQVGVLQADAIVQKLGLDKGAKGPFNIELFAGSADDNNALMFFNGSMSVLKPYLDSGVLVVRSGQSQYEQVTTLRWDGDRAKARMQRVLQTAYADAKVDAVLSPYDGMSRGVLAALTEAGYGKGGLKVPVVTGQDAEIDSVKSIQAGQQQMTVFKDTRELAKVTVQLGRSLLRGQEPDTTDAPYDNGKVKVPTYLLPPIAVDKSNINTLLVSSGYIKADELK